MIGNVLTDKILVIDDDEAVNSILTRILSTRFGVESHFNAEDALSQCDFSGLDVVLTDVNLPGVSGIELLRRVHEKDPLLPVIMITGENDIDVAISSLKNGATDFILKPFNFDQIMIAVDRARERRRLQRENILLMSQLQNQNAALEELNRQIKTRNAEMEHDLDIASNLQSCLFPLAMPEFETVRFAYRIRPYEKISGDFFEFIVYDNKRFAVIFADVSGHGVPAALYSAMVKAAILSLGDEHPVPPAVALARMNRFLIHAQKKMSYNYATVFFANVDLERMIVTYCNAGIPAPVVLRSGNEILKLGQNSPFVGIFDEATYDEQMVRLQKDDRLVMFTDGAYEAFNENDATAGYEDLVGLIEGLQDESIGDMIDKVYNHALQTCGEDNPDDMTVLGIKFC